VTPYADFTYFGLLLLYVVLPTLVLGLFARAGWRWILISSAFFLTIQLSGKLKLPGLPPKPKRSYHENVRRPYWRQSSIGISC